MWHVLRFLLCTRCHRLKIAALGSGASQTAWARLRADTQLSLPCPVLPAGPWMGLGPQLQGVALSLPLEKVTTRSHSTSMNGTGGART